ncbi:MAG: hypothetical protein EOO43_21870 [Flavobacterium sp.]|nr:MAG: hypothetical protein EOO43_21870 [Flavobacterium sp.]
MISISIVKLKILDFTAFQRSPKWICGFSDITVLHSHLQAQFGIPSLHCPMGAAFKQYRQFCQLAKKHSLQPGYRYPKNSSHGPQQATGHAHSR